MGTATSAEETPSIAESTCTGGTNLASESLAALGPQPAFSPWPAMRPGGIGDPVSCVLFVFVLTYSLWFVVIPPKGPAGGSGPPLLHATPHGPRPVGPKWPQAPQALRPSALTHAPIPLPSLTTARLSPPRPSAGSPGPTAPRLQHSVDPAPAPGRPAAPVNWLPQLNTALQPEGFGNMMYPIVRNTPLGNPERAYQSSPAQGFLGLLDPYVKQYDDTRQQLRGMLSEMTWRKNNPTAMETLHTIGTLAEPGYAKDGGPQSPHWEVIAQNVKTAEPYLRRALMIRQLFGDPPYASAPGLQWAGKSVFPSVDVGSVGSTISNWL